jgi:hypothetical protein
MHEHPRDVICTSQVPELQPGSQSHLDAIPVYNTNMLQGCKSWFFVLQTGGIGECISNQEMSLVS